MNTKVLILENPPIERGWIGQELTNTNCNYTTK
ncbi:hypothetical protein BJQ96_02289 [Flavobacterium sp. PL0002]|nr:hypothetical protein [Flavobacterium sp. PL002]